ncbi:hypothetical protein BRYFOR_08565 [Marvinbryantia formatexigens DSM 14469]|uniref:Uncharacterized protein n=2 Tax=Marvinbryantia TaxID=248744 RepID=C6LIT5_9FIRM|nr:hypothetical protein BRYFOR_08565 [Marvinbryantia formatexigens DSM 14469]
MKLRKRSPEIFVVAGVVTGVVSAVMACRATMKIDEVLQEPREDIDDIHKYVEEHGYSDKYGEKDEKKDLLIAYTHSGIGLAKLYAPSVTLGVVSIAAILGGHNLLRKRNVALVAAYKTVNKGFKEYRGRVVERFGYAVDKELRYNVRQETIEETVTDSETGEEKTVTKTINVASHGEPSEFAKFFDEGCEGWTKDPDLNLMFLRRQQDYANDRLKERGYLFLNEVYDMLGIQRTRSGQIVGWFYDENNPIGDNYVDFGIYDGSYAAKRNFVNGYERTILLDFNVDGPIIDLI